MQKIEIESKEEIYTVSRLNNEVRFLLENNFPIVWVEGEISNFAAPNSGHWYFCLKDSLAQVRCAMFKGHQRKLGFIVKDGMHVLIKARVSLYENRGEFQLIAEDMEERGEGKLRRAFEVLKKKLEAAGLFDPAHKKSLPLFPQHIGIVTSPTGAAIRDILTVLKRRYPCAHIVIYPTLVQGEQAATHIVSAIQIANRRTECDVLIVTRGGGSLEDLWPFNEEIVAQAIFQSNIPIVSGVGHEIDYTIADFVADKRAPTPSAAAEIIAPSCAELLQGVTQYKQQIARLIKRKLTGINQQLLWTRKHLYQQHPKRQLAEKMQRVDFLESRLVQLQLQFINKMQIKLKTVEAQLQRFIPVHQLNQLNNQLQLSQQQLSRLMTLQLHQQKIQLGNVAAKLDGLSPLATLKRGYAIATKDQQVLRHANEVQVRDKIHVRLLKGSLECQVEKIVDK